MNLNRIPAMPSNYVDRAYHEREMAALEQIILKQAAIIRTLKKMRAVK